MNIRRTQNQPAAGPLRLPSLETIPTQTDIMGMQYQAQAMRGRQIQLSWNVEGRTEPYLLSVTWDSGRTDPSWTLQYGESKTCWTYDSGDLSVILNFVLGECTGNGTVAQAAGGVSGTPEVASEFDFDDPSNFEQTRQLKRVSVTNQGDLKDTDLSGLLRSYSIAAATGKLAIEGADGTAIVFFTRGNPVHAEVGGIKGEKAMMELFTWRSGHFRFNVDDTTASSSITQRVDALVTQGKGLREKSDQLWDLGVKPESFLMRKGPPVSDDQLAVRLRIPVQAAAVIHRFLDQNDGSSSLRDTVKRLGMAASEWIPLVFSLLNAELLDVQQKRETPAPESGSAEVVAATVCAVPEFDRTMVETVRNTLVRAETGFFIYPVLLYFADLEMTRFEITRQPWNLVVISLRGINAAADGLPPPAVKAITDKIAQMKRKMDIAGHYEVRDLAIILPNSDPTYGQVFCQRLNQMLINECPLPGLTSADVEIRFTLVCVPDHAGSMAELMAAVREARQRANAANPIAAGRKKPGAGETA